MKLSTWLYGLSAALFITAFTVDAHELKTAQEKVWSDADAATKLGSNSNVASNTDGSLLSK